MAQGPTAIQMFPSPSLTCGLPANETIYDHLDGVRLRETHPPYAEPEVAMIFKKTEIEDIDMNEVEANLKRNLEEVKMFSCRSIHPFIIHPFIHPFIHPSIHSLGTLCTRIF